MATREEQETIVTMGRVSDYMDIWTNNVVHVRALEKESRAERMSPCWLEPEAREAELLSEYLDAGFGVEYRVKAEDARILNVFGRKVKPKTEEQKKEIAARLAAGRA